MNDRVATTTTTGNDNDDWEVAVDTGEFDKRLEQQEKARAANQEPVISSLSSIGNDDDTRNSSSINLMKSNKPIRILKRPTSQSQIPTNNDVTKSSIATTNTTSTTFNNTNTTASNNNNNSSLPSSMNASSSTTVPIVSIIPRIQTKDSTNTSQSINTSSSSSTFSSSQTTKPAIKTYEQRELEYRLARLRIMGEEESSAKDDNDLSTAESIPVSTDDSTKTSISSSLSSSSTTRTMNQTNSLSHQSLQCHSTPGSYASNLYTLNNTLPNTGTIHFTQNNINSSTPNLGTGLFSSPNIPQNYRGAYPVPYSHIPPQTGPPHYPFTPATTTTTLYMTSTAPFVTAPPPSSSSSSVSSSYHYSPQQHVNMSTNNWYNYQHSSAPSGAQQFGHPQ